MNGNGAKKGKAQGRTGVQRSDRPVIPLCIADERITGGAVSKGSVCPHCSREAGVSLLEVLIAVVILAVGLLGVAALQTQAVKANHSAAQKSEATMLAYLILDAMRANRDAALAGSYNLSSLTCTPPSGGTLAQNDLRYWLQQAQAVLGINTCGQVSCDGASTCTVTLRWDDSRAGGSSTQTFTLASRL